MKCEPPALILVWPLCPGWPGHSPHCTECREYWLGGDLNTQRVTQWCGDICKCDGYSCLCWGHLNWEGYCKCKTITSSSVINTAHPSWMGHLPKIVTGEVVYYILSGTPRAPQKCFWSHLRVEFSGENHLFLICGKMPNQTLWITKYLDSGLNSDLFRKKKIPNRTFLDCYR